MKIIINADDLGYAIDRDNIAFSLMEAGKITSSTIITVAPNYDYAIHKAKCLKYISFGIHLVLTEFRLLSGDPIFQNIGITNANHDVISDIRKLNIKSLSSLQKAIFNEWRLQIEKALDCGLKLSHLDSHHHVHNSWWLFPVIKKLQNHFKIERFRSVTRYYLFRNDAKRFHLRSDFRHFMLRRYCSVRTPDYFTNFEEGLWFLKKYPQYNIDAIVEMMCHPGNPAYESETQLLLSDWMDNIKKRYNLVNYTEI